MNVQYIHIDGVYNEIREALGEYADQHDIEAIANEAYTYENGRFKQTCGTDEFWAIVERHAI